MIRDSFFMYYQINPLWLAFSTNHKGSISSKQFVEYYGIQL